MRPVTIPFICLLLLLLSDTAQGAPKGLFLLGGIEQNITLAYNINGQTASSGGKSSSSLNNRLTEIYRFHMPLAIYSRRILELSLTGKLRFDQSYFSSDSASSPTSTAMEQQFLYNVRGLIFKKSPTPIHFFLTSELDHIERSFSPGYDQTTDTYGFGASINNVLVPLNVNYSNTRTESSGLEHDLVHTYELWTLDAHRTTVNTNSSVALSHGRNTSGAKGVDPATPSYSESNYNASLRNAISSRDKKQSLNSSLLLRDQRQTTGRTSSYNWQEQLLWSLGRALDCGLTYSSDFYSITTDPQPAITSRNRSETFFITHNLFSSLTTTVNLAARQSDYSNGTEDTTGGAIQFNYRKRLHDDGQLELVYHEGLSETNRNLTTTSVRVTDEGMTLQSLANNLLRNPEVETSSILVRDADPAALLGTYLLGTDYLLTTVGAFTGINIDIPGSRITSNRNVLVSYTYRISPKSRFMTSVRQAGGILFLQGNRYRINANFQQSNNENISGLPEGRTMSRSTSFDLGFSETIDGLIWSVLYSNVMADTLTAQSFEATARWQGLMQGGVVTLYAREHFSIIEQNTFVNQRRRTENLITAAASYTRFLTSHMRLITSGSVTDIHDSNGSGTDELRLDSSLSWARGKLAIVVNGKAGLRFTRINTLADYGLNIMVNRYF